MLTDIQTDRQTNRHGHTNTPIPYRGRNTNVQLMIYVQKVPKYFTRYGLLRQCHYCLPGVQCVCLIIAENKQTRITSSFLANEVILSVAILVLVSVVRVADTKISSRIRFSRRPQPVR